MDSLCVNDERIQQYCAASCTPHQFENTFGFIIASIVLLLLQTDAFSQAVEVFWADTRGIHRMNLEDSVPKTIIEVIIHTPQGVALDAPNGKMYWTNSVVNKIMRANLDGSEIQSIIDGQIAEPYDIALDVQRGKMYWTSQSVGAIQRANLDGSEVEDLVIDGIDLPREIVLDAQAGKMYWAEKTAIRRANLDGSMIEDLVVDGLGEASGIALDLHSGKIYWTTLQGVEHAGDNQIQRSNLDGSEVEILLTKEVLYGPKSLSLDVQEGKMYWIDDNSIRRANLDGSNLEEVVFSTFTFPELDNPLSVELDVLAGKVYWVDRKSHQIQRANLDGSDLEDIVDPTAVTPTSIEVDQAGEKIYWVDPSAMRVRRANIDGSEIESLTYYKYSDYLTLLGLALGENEEKVYLSGSLIGYLNPGNANINYLVTSPRRIVFEIALDQAESKMYWLGQNAIERANLDGSDIETLVVTSVDSLFQLKNDSIVLDTLAGKMYWTDSKNNKIHRANLDGSDIEDILTVIDPQAIAVDVLSEKLYWISTTGQNGIMYRANLDGSDITPVLLAGVSLPHDLVLLSSLASSNTEEGPALSGSVALGSAYPNPFSAYTNIEYSLDVATHVNVRIYDILGRLVAIPFNGVQLPGRHLLKWDGSDGHGVEVAAGVYIIRVALEGKKDKVQTILKMN